jgi:hypothetical protein
MSSNNLFSILNTVALAAWVLLVVLPRKKWVLDVVAGRAVPALMAVAYVGIIAANYVGSEGGFSSLAEVEALFSNPWLLLAGWTHYLAFDLLIGVWEVRDSMERGISHAWVVPCLLLTFLLGPAGWLSYLAVRRVATSA